MTSFTPSSSPFAAPQARKLSSGLLKAIDAHVYEVPTGRSATINSMWIASTHTGSVSVRVHHTRPGEDASTSNALIYDYSLSSKTTIVYDQLIYLNSGDKIVVRADTADKICVTLYGVEA